MINGGNPRSGASAKGLGNKIKQRLKYMSKREKVVIGGAVVAVCLGLLTTTCFGYKVEVDGKVIGYAKEASAFTDSLSNVEAQLQEETGVKSAYVYNDINIEKSFLLGKDEYTTDDFTQALDSMDLTTGCHGVDLIVDGNSVGYLADEEQAQDTVTEAINKYADIQQNDKVISYEIKSDVKTEEKSFPISEMTCIEKCSDYLATGIKGDDYNTFVPEETTEVASRGGEVDRQEGVPEQDPNAQVDGTQAVDPNADTAAQTAVDDPNAQPVADQAVQTEDPAAQPAEDPNAQAAEAENSVGPLKLNVVKTSTITEAISYETETIEDPNVYVDQVTISQPGQLGSKDKEVEYIYEDGKVVSERIVSETITLEPVKEVISKGTKEFTTQSSVKGDYILPANGEITALDKPGSHAGCFAVDIAAPSGSPIYAPQDGTVIMTEYYGGYGNTVQIKMDDGTTFLMGHNSAYNCKVGDRVKKGDVVAFMGSTGNSTGPHCHFELYIGGVKQYLPTFFKLTEGATV